MLHPSGLPFICWLCCSLSLSRADPFSALSVISNNVTASLVSIHQSRKKPILTLLKKKKCHLCLPGTERAGFRALAAPTAGALWPQPAISPQQGNQIPQAVLPPWAQKSSPGLLSQGLTLGTFSAHKNLGLAFFSPFFFVIGFSFILSSI